MSKVRFASTRKWFGKFWWLLDSSRRVTFNLLFLAIVLILVVAWIKSGPPSLGAKTALVFDLHGSIAEQKVGSLGQSALDQVRGNSAQKIQLRDVRTVLDAAGADPKIKRLVLILDELDGAG
ncbi:MAG TPA: signal peptide peptidase SppA, partial [Caldimonas sp.]